MTIPLLTPTEILARVAQNHVRFIDLQFTDVAGMVKNVTIPANQLARALDHGVWFDGSAIEGFARLAESDMYLRPDPATFMITPWQTGQHATARLICNICTPDRQPFLGDPRAVLARVLAEAAEMGFRYNTGPELEFFLLRPQADGGLLPPVPQDSHGYFDAPTDLSTNLRRDMTEALESVGITVEALHHEVATGQHEIDIRYADALTTADNIVTFRIAVKAIAQQAGLYATFMPKPLRGIAGSGMHIHQSLVYIATGRNAFADPGDAHGLSSIAKQFLAGQLAHARAMCAILAPLVNSYKRLVAGYEAPVSICWARINRSALIRIPRAHAHDSTRIELRCPDPACNPYLASAVMLAAGLDGIKRGLPAPEATEENMYRIDHEQREHQSILPGSLNQALHELEHDSVLQAALGAHVYDRFLHTKRAEWDDYQLEVTGWELRKYLSTF